MLDTPVCLSLFNFIVISFTDAYSQWGGRWGDAVSDNAQSSGGQDTTDYQTVLKYFCLFTCVNFR